MDIFKFLTIAFAAQTDGNSKCVDALDLNPTDSNQGIGSELIFTDESSLHSADNSVCSNTDACHVIDDKKVLLEKETDDLTSMDICTAIEETTKIPNAILMSNDEEKTEVICKTYTTEEVPNELEFADISILNGEMTNTVDDLFLIEGITYDCHIEESDQQNEELNGLHTQETVFKENLFEKLTNENVNDAPLVEQIDANVSTGENNISEPGLFDVIIEIAPEQTNYNPLINQSDKIKNLQEVEEILKSIDSRIDALIENAKIKSAQKKAALKEVDQHKKAIESLTRTINTFADSVNSNKVDAAQVVFGDKSSAPEKNVHRNKGNNNSYNSNNALRQIEFSVNELLHNRLMGHMLPNIFYGLMLE